MNGVQSESTQKSTSELIEEGQPLVHSLAFKICRSIPVRIELDDLIAYGEVGLAEAARDFDASRGVQFTTFAYYRVRGAIYDGLSEMSWISRARYKRLCYDRMANEALQNMPTSPDSGSTEQDAKWFGEVTEKLAVVYLIAHHEGAEGITDSTIEDTRAQATAIVAGKEIDIKLHELVDRLPSAEQRLIRKVYFEGKTLQKSANVLGISKSWASRLHARSLEQLARWLRQYGADDCVA